MNLNSQGRDSTPDRDRNSIYGSRALYSANDVKPHQSQSFQTLEEISSILISEMKKKPRKEKALRDGLELQVESDRKLFRHNILPNISTEYSAETE